jgi:hypothetical protein
MIDLQAQIRDPEGRNGVATLENQLTHAHEILGFGTSTNDKSLMGQFDSAVMLAVQGELSRRKVKSLSFDERQNIIDRMMISGELNTGFFAKAAPDSFVADLGKVFGIGPDRRYYQVVNTPDAANFVPTKALVSDVPPASSCARSIHSPC